MPENDKRTCGNCGWADPRHPGDLYTAECDWFDHNPLPACMSTRPSFVYMTDGVDCQCWKPKDPICPT
jgi:hypothetical protein